MNKRLSSIGVKQIIHLEWMQKTANYLLAGMDASAIRRELYEFLSERDDTSRGEARSPQARTFAVTNLMKVWVSTEPELTAFRDETLALLHEHPLMGLALHWGMISSAYPFWFNTAKHTGRLLALQGKVSSSQIAARLREQYGDRETVSRHALFVIRSFVSWGVLVDSEEKGCYERGLPQVISNPDVASCMLESALYTLPEGSKAPLEQLTSSPALFAFRLPRITGELISRSNGRIEVIRCGLDDELLKLKQR